MIVFKLYKSFNIKSFFFKKNVLLKLFTNTYFVFNEKNIKMYSI